MLVILGSLRQQDPRFTASPGHIVILCLKRKGVGEEGEKGRRREGKGEGREKR